MSIAIQVTFNKRAAVLFQVSKSRTKASDFRTDLTPTPRTFPHKVGSSYKVLKNFAFAKEDISTQQKQIVSHVLFLFSED